MAITPGTQIGVDGKRYEAGSQPTDPDEFQVRPVRVQGQLDAGDVPQWDGTKFVDASVLPTTGGTMTGSLVSEMEASDDPSLVVQVSGEAEPRWVVSGDGLVPTNGTSPDGPTLGIVDTSGGYLQTSFRVTPATEGDDVIAMAFVQKGQGQGSDAKPYFMLAPEGAYIWMGGNGTTTAGGAELWNSTVGQTRLPRLNLYSGVANSPEPLIQVGPFSGAYLAKVWNNGDVEVCSSSAGVILRAPNGGRWRLKVNNAGTLITESVA